MPTSAGCGFVPSSATASHSETQTCSSNDCNGYPQEGRGNGGDALVWAFVLPIEQSFELALQITSSTVLFRSFESIHGWPIIFPECIDELERRPGIVESVRVSDN